jgi:hypothetical protein
MQLKGNRAPAREERETPPANPLSRPHWSRSMAGIAVMVMFMGGALSQQYPNPDKSIHPPVLTTPPDANAQMRMREQTSKEQNYEAANAERKRQIAEDSARLLKLANDLKAEVDKTNKDTLSLIVIHKAEEIERLAHSVKEKMKLTVGPG